MNENFPPKIDSIPQNPKLKLHLRGLGVLCFSADHDRAEIGYLDIPGHDALITIVNSKCEPVLPLTSMRGMTLEILTSKKGIGKCFYRPDSPMNFDQMLDLSEIYGASADFRKPLPLQSRIYIDNAVFFTDPKSINTVIPFEQNCPSNVKDPIQIGQGLFAYISDENVSINLNDQKISLDPSEAYTIIILSECRRASESDFKYYYEMLQNAGGIQYNLKYPGGPNAWFNDCETYQFSELADDFKKLSSAAATGDDKVREREAFLAKLTHLSGIFRCAPQPCLKVTFANRPRNLE